MVLTFWLGDVELVFGDGSFFSRLVKTKVEDKIISLSLLFQFSSSE